LLELVPTTYKHACSFILKHHRHHLPPQGWKFGIAVRHGPDVVGCITVGRPIARLNDNGFTLEVTRCCTSGYYNAASMLYAAAWRAVKAMGYTRLITYTLKDEPGTSVISAGFKFVHHTRRDHWKRKNRHSSDLNSNTIKSLYERT